MRSKYSLSWIQYIKCSMNLGHVNNETGILLYLQVRNTPLAASFLGILQSILQIDVNSHDRWDLSSNNTIALLIYKTITKIFQKIYCHKILWEKLHGCNSSIYNNRSINAHTIWNSLSVFTRSSKQPPKGTDNSIIWQTLFTWINENIVL